MTPKLPRIAVVGATGVVGREALKILAQRRCPPQNVIALASSYSTGMRLPFGDFVLTVRPLNDYDFANVDFALFCSTADVARRLAPGAVRAGAVVIDNSSAFRADPAASLVIPQVNPNALKTTPTKKLIANPNCSTILLLTALEPLRRAFGLARIDVSTYQAVSGAGLKAMQELLSQTRAVLADALPNPQIFPHPCAFNVFPHESPIDQLTGLNGEESKIISESRRIWDDKNIRVIPHCARVPVLRAHSQAVTVKLIRPAPLARIKAALANAPSITLIDERTTGQFPTPLLASNRDEILVGRLRPTPGEPIDPDDPVKSVCLWLCGDQIRKGAALNAVEIMDALITNLPCMPRAMPR